jgi:transposase
MSDTGSKKPQRVEVITSVQRRRRWSVAEKIRIVQECEQPGMSVSYVAHKYDIAPNLLFRWRRLMREVVYQPSRPTYR